MKKRLFVFSLLFAALIVMPLQGDAATGKESVENQVNKILEKLKDPAFKEQPRDAKIAEVRKIIKRFLITPSYPKERWVETGKNSAMPRKQNLSAFSVFCSKMCMRIEF